MSIQSVSLRLARMLRFGRFPRNPGPNDWNSASFVSPADRDIVLAAALRIADGTVDIQNPPGSTIGDVYGGTVSLPGGKITGGPFGKPTAMIDVRPTVVTKDGSTEIRRTRLELPWDMPWQEIIQIIIDQINNILNKCKKGLGSDVDHWFIEPEDFWAW